MHEIFIVFCKKMKSVQTYAVSLSTKRSDQYDNALCDVEGPNARYKLDEIADRFVRRLVKQGK